LGCIRVEVCTDGYDHSDTRDNLRRHLEVDRFHVAQSTIAALAADGKMTAKDVAWVS
jgi:pyruvate dehydrogenase E1 component